MKRLTAVPNDSLVLRPLRRMAPERNALVASRLARASSSVDFPDPDGPMSAVRVPGSAYPVRPSKTLCVSPLPRVTVTVKSFQVSRADTSPMSSVFVFSFHRVSLNGLRPPTTMPFPVGLLASISTITCPAELLTSTAFMLLHPRESRDGTPTGYNKSGLLAHVCHACLR